MSTKLLGSLNPITRRLVGGLNIYTMATGDGRDIELAVVGEYICWRRVNDNKWIQLLPISSLKGDTPSKGIDYWTDEDKAEILEYVNKAVGGSISHNNLLDRDDNNAHPISAITGLTERLNSIQDKNYIHNQRVASDYWLIDHNLNKYPAVSVVDSAGTVVSGDITYNNVNTLTIKFIGAFSGKAYLN